MATEIEPVSSDTMTTTASEFSLMPMPARWRMPRSRLRFTFLLSGSIQPAPSIRPWRMMTAPSCIGAFTKKMFFSSSEDTAASSIVPLRTMSSRRMSRSNTMRTPVLLWDISLHAMTVWSMAVSSAVCCCTGPKALNILMLRLPIFSSICRISGWNRTMMAMMPTCTRLPMM